MKSGRRGRWWWPVEPLHFVLTKVLEGGRHRRAVDQQNEIATIPGDRAANADRIQHERALVTFPDTTRTVDFSGPAGMV